MKTVEEWSNAFDVLVDSYRRFKDFDKKLELDSIEFNEYEKSVYLTLALLEIVKDIYSGNTLQFEVNEESRRYLDCLIETANCTNNSASILQDSFLHSSFSLPINCWFIVYELASYTSSDSCINNYIADVVPVTHDDYLRTIRNPFRGPNKRKVLRLDNNKLSVELVSKYPINIYTIRYLSKPEPIILADLTYDNISIDGISHPNICKLNDSLHLEILERAVNIALTIRINNTNKKTSK